MEEANVWDFLIRSLPIFAVVLGFVVSHYLKNHGKVIVDVKDFNFDFRTLDEGPQGKKLNKDLDIQEAKELYISILFDVFNQKENFNSIKDLGLKLKTGNRYEEIEEIKISINGREMKKYRNDCYLNIVDFRPKEIKKISFIAQKQLDEKLKIKLMEFGFSIHFTYTTNKGKKKEKVLKQVNKENIA